MKHMNVKWVPGTIAIVSLTVATAQDGPKGTAERTASIAGSIAPTRTKVIVISDGPALKANGTMMAN